MYAICDPVSIYLYPVIPYPQYLTSTFDDRS
jgi:hypothetical protein